MPETYARSKNSAVATVVFVHAHPDDEAIFTAGTMRLLSEAGHRVVLVVATGGELGLPHEDAAGPDHLAAVRRDETDAAAGLLGVARTEVAGRLAAILEDEQASALVTYDETGIYGHPDHLQVHRAASMAASRVGTQ